MTNLPTILPVVSTYRNEIRFTLGCQVVFTLFSLLILDEGEFAKVAGCTMCGFWLGVAIIMIRRPLNPRPGDLAFIRWGYFPMFVAGMCLAPFVVMPRS